MRRVKILAFGESEVSKLAKTSLKLRFGSYIAEAEGGISPGVFVNFVAFKNSAISR